MSRALVIINGVRERWEVEHVIALELGGSDTQDNWAPKIRMDGTIVPREGA